MLSPLHFLPSYGLHQLSYCHLLYTSSLLFPHIQGSTKKTRFRQFIFKITCIIYMGKICQNDHQNNKMHIPFNQVSILLEVNPRDTLAYV